MPGLLPCCWHSPKLSLQQEVLQELGHGPEEGAKPKLHAPELTPDKIQTDFDPELTPALHPEGLGTPAQGLGPSKFVPWHVQPRAATGELSQLQALEKQEHCANIYSALRALSPLPFAVLRTALSAVYRQQGTPQRA